MKNLNRKTFICIKKALFAIFCAAFMISLLIFPTTAVASSTRGLNLWLGIVFPTIFPFLVCSEILNKTGFIKVIGVLFDCIMRPMFGVPGCASFAFVIGLISGYPVGAKITSELRTEGLITKIEAEKLLTFTNNSGPLFIIGAVATGILKMPQVGIFLLLSHILASLTVGILFKFYKNKGSVLCNNKKLNSFTKFKCELLKYLKVSDHNIGEILIESIKNSISTILAIGGFIILFSVIISILVDTGVILLISKVILSFLTTTQIQEETIISFISGLFEITSGINMLSLAHNVDINQKLSAISFIIGFAGLSIHAQVLGITAKSDISIKPYLLGKFMHGMFSTVYTIILTKTFIPYTNNIEAFSKFNSTQYSPNFFEYFMFSIKGLLLIFAMIIFFILVSFIPSIKRKNFI